LVERHGGVRAAARVIKVNYAYLSRLRSGEKTNPTDAVLRKLGLRKIVVYAPIKPMRTMLEIEGQRLEMKP
jgi:hypothetical protein